MAAALIACIHAQFLFPRFQEQRCMCVGAVTDLRKCNFRVPFNYGAAIFSVALNSPVHVSVLLQKRLPACKCSAGLVEKSQRDFDYTGEEGAVTMRGHRRR